MEFTQEFIDALMVNEVDIMQKIASEENIQLRQVSAVISLVKEGCTIPFISRYRKEQHGSLDEVQVRDCDQHFKSYHNLESRRLEIIRGIFNQGKLNDYLYEAVKGAKTLTELEDLWAPFKKKKKTRGMLAIERGLEPLADAMLEKDDSTIEKLAVSFVQAHAENEELSVATAEDAIAGAKDILAERIAQDSENRSRVRELYLKTGTIEVKGTGDADVEKTSVYQMYWDYVEPLNEIKPHRILAINRGEREGVLHVTITVDVESAIVTIQKRYALHNRYHKEAIEDGLVRLLSPAVVREIRSDKTDEADGHGIGVFSENLKNLLMTQPLKGTRILGIDPGIRTGTKCAALDETGKYLGYFMIYQHKAVEAAAAIAAAIKKYSVQIVAIGNGTGTKEVQEVVATLIKAEFPDVHYTVVDEDGASVYSAGDIAREEFPDLDLTIRGAISIGRRLQDPLAELVKIDPKSIGVGLYQHDVNQKRLSETLDDVVGSVVNNVGVNINTASASLLKYVSGISSSLAKRIVAYRDTKGKIISREELQTISGLGPKAYEQCAGFLKIPESTDPLDNTWVHPENYGAARVVFDAVKQNKEITVEALQEVKNNFSIGEQTLKDIIDELKKPNRDPRDDCPKPIILQNVVSFDDLHEGMKITGKIKNVVDFGAFVDVSIKETALVHVSELSDNFISDPMDIVKVGEVKEFTIIALDHDRRRISLSLKTNPTLKTQNGTTVQTKTTQTTAGEKYSTNEQKQTKRVVKVAKKTAQIRERRPETHANNDGTTYNPFANLLKK